MEIFHREKAAIPSTKPGLLYYDCDSESMLLASSGRASEFTRIATPAFCSRAPQAGLSQEKKMCWRGRLRRPRQHIFFSCERGEVPRVLREKRVNSQALRRLASFLAEWRYGKRVCCSLLQCNIGTHL